MGSRLASPLGPPQSHGSLQPPSPPFPATVPEAGGHWLAGSASHTELRAGPPTVVSVSLLVSWVGFQGLLQDVSV